MCTTHSGKCQVWTKKTSKEEEGIIRGWSSYLQILFKNLRMGSSNSTGIFQTVSVTTTETSAQTPFMSIKYVPEIRRQLQDKDVIEFRP